MSRWVHRVRGVLDHDPGPQPVPRRIAQVALGAALAFTGIGHLTFGREEFRAQVPPWVPVDDDVVVLVSGVVELGLAAALVLSRRRRVPVGWLTAAFFVAIFPGNIAQFTTQTDAFGLESDAARAIRLVFQPVLVAWALWSTQAWQAVRDSARASDATPGPSARGGGRVPVAGARPGARRPPERGR